jgi:hypothetical protein
VKINLPSFVNTLLLLAIAAVCTYWLLQWGSVRSPPTALVTVPVGDRVARTQPLDMSAAARLFGAPTGADDTGHPLATDLTARVRLDGVIAQGGKGKGIALISVDERPSLAYRAGEAIDSNLTLADVRADRIVIRTPTGRHEVQIPARAVPVGIVPAR